MTPDATARAIELSEQVYRKLMVSDCPNDPEVVATLCRKCTIDAYAAELTATASLVREELTKWLHHEPMCLAHPKNLVAGRKSECDCGLSAALRAQERG